MSEFKSRRYACIQWPFLRLGIDGSKGGLKFENGFFTATNEDQVNAIESNAAFGVHIHPIKWEPKPVPSKPGKIESLIESEIADTLAERQPRARRGAISTRTHASEK